VDTKDPNSNLDTKSGSESGSELGSESGSEYESDGWNQYFDIESQTIINSKNRNYCILNSYLQCGQFPSNKLFKRKNQTLNQSSKKTKKVDIVILDSIKEEEIEIFEDIETGKIYKNETKINANANPKIYLYLINLQKFVVTSLIYISHVALIIFLVRV
jgi:hypothetical protein